MKRPKPNYEIENYCSYCEIVYPKPQVRCDICHHKVRTHPAAGIRNHKYQEAKVRI